jgi:hypothetical protein
MKNGIELITEERQRQIEVEGWTPEHDHSYQGVELIRAAEQYLEASAFSVQTGRTDGDQYFGGLPPTPHKWPWADEWWKPTYDNPIRMLTKAGALIAAEIDRLQRLAPDHQAAGGE